MQTSLHTDDQYPTYYQRSFRLIEQSHPKPNKHLLIATVAFILLLELIIVVSIISIHNELLMSSLKDNTYFEYIKIEGRINTFPFFILILMGCCLGMLRTRTILLILAGLTSTCFAVMLMNVSIPSFYTHIISYALLIVTGSIIFPFKYLYINRHVDLATARYCYGFIYLIYALSIVLIKLEIHILAKLNLLETLPINTPTLFDTIWSASMMLPLTLGWILVYLWRKNNPLHTETCDPENHEYDLVYIILGTIGNIYVSNMQVFKGLFVLLSKEPTLSPFSLLALTLLGPVIAIGLLPLTGNTRARYVLPISTLFMITVIIMSFQSETILALAVMLSLVCLPTLMIHIDTLIRQKFIKWTALIYAVMMAVCTLFNIFYIKVF